MNYKEFYTACLHCAQDIEYQGEHYLDSHAVRFFKTFEICSNLLNHGDRILSIGAGSSYVETMLVRESGAKAVLVDFPESIELYKNHYAENGFIKTVAADLSKENVELEIEPVDLVLSTEIIEHIPEPPSQHFLKFEKYLRPGGYFIVTTPNLASLQNIINLFRMHPLLPAAERTFAPVCFENEGTHRREYMPVEIIDSMAQSGISHQETRFIWYRKPTNLKVKIKYCIELFVPRFRPAMIISGRKGKNVNRTAD